MPRELPNSRIRKALPCEASPHFGSLQLTGHSDFLPPGARRVRGVSIGAPCRLCFQPGKDVMVPGFPGIQDYPDDYGKEIGAHRGRVPVCRRLATLAPYSTYSWAAPRPLWPEGNRANGAAKKGYTCKDTQHISCAR